MTKSERYLGLVMPSLSLVIIGWMIGLGGEAGGEDGSTVWAVGSINEVGIMSFWGI